MVSTNQTKTLAFTYDYQGRRIEKKVWNNTTGTGTPATHLKYIYDGWNLIAELNGNSNNAKVRTYTWGLDISGSTTEAGGVGGLLLIDDNTNGVHFVSYDLNGNVMGLIKATNGTISASYEYGPFGELLVSTGTMASSNPFRFSTKYRDTETDLYYYGYRYYSPSLGRWISRDPIDEQGGLNLYAFVNNDPVNKWDLYGFSPYCVCIRAADDHAWIYVFDMEKKTKATYSRYKKKWGNPPADSSGVLENMDLSRYYEVQRCIQVDLFTPEINEGYDWRRNNCASYVASEWKRVSGEVLNITGKRNLPENKQKESASWIYNWFDSPEIIVESIRRSNGGVKRFSTCCGGYPPKK